VHWAGNRKAYGDYQPPDNWEAEYLDTASMLLACLGEPMSWDDFTPQKTTVRTLAGKLRVTGLLNYTREILDEFKEVTPRPDDEEARWCEQLYAKLDTYSPDDPRMWGEPIVCWHGDDTVKSRSWEVCASAYCGVVIEKPGRLSAVRSLEFPSAAEAAEFVLDGDTPFDPFNRRGEVASRLLDLAETRQKVFGLCDTDRVAELRQRIAA